MPQEQVNDNNRGGYKVWFDLSILIVAHITLLPFWILLWTIIPIVIWLDDRGPIFFRQNRAGKDGKVITILKFRTMNPDADRMGPAWTTAGDPRITRMGRILRRTALDELPEVLSIWKRDMSLVGPRALDLSEQAELERLVPGFEKRLCVLPGLTGLAQLNDRTDDANTKIRYDLEYLEKMSPWLDVRLIWQSVWNTLSARWDNRSGKPLKSTLDASNTANSDTENADDEGAPVNSENLN